MRKAVLAGVCLNEERFRFEQRMEECRALCTAGNIEVAATVTQNSRSLDPDTAFRMGKVQELAAVAAQCEADLIVFLQELSFGMISRLREACGIEVIDRTALILDIFSRRARSRQAKLQVELARLNYDLPSFAADTESEEHARGGSFRTRGSGETRTAAFRRTARKRIARIRKELAEKEKDYQAAEHRRGKSELARCALVGYTNAGKSSLMNAILACNQKQERAVYADDMLFATLDSSVRSVSWEGRKFLLYDTVGFVSDLPHTLIEAFHSTLDSARSADLLIHVIDVSDPDREEKADVTRETLREIGADDIPVISVYTKADRLNGEVLSEGMLVSSVTGQGIGSLLERILDTLYPPEKTMRVCVPYADTPLLEDLRQVLKITDRREEADGIHATVCGPAVRMKPLERYEENDEDSLGNL
ncbi:MAG: GTPase HflX [Solobacterium sp.]|nr:GTPase HflX [Solobacterium sp.]